MNIKELRISLNLSQQKLSDLTGIPKGRINGWEQKGTNPKAKDYKTLENFFAQYKPSSIVSNADPIAEVIDEDEVWKNWAGVEFRELEDGTFFMSVPLVEDYAEAGYLNGWNDRNFVEELPKHTINVEKRHMGKYRAFRVRGESMDDGSRSSICNRDIVVGRNIERQLWNSKFHLHKFEYYVIVHKEGIVVKRIAKHDVENGIITCISLNPNKSLYPDYDINLSDLYEIYNIISVERRMWY